MHVASVCITADDIKNNLPEEYKDCEVIIINSEISNFGQELIFDCVVANDIHDTRKEVRYKMTKLK